MPEQVPPGDWRINTRYCLLAGAEAYCVATRTACYYYYYYYYYYYLVAVW